MIVRGAIAAIAALLVGAQVVRNAAVLEFAGDKPAVAARFWSDHPATELSLGMTRIAEATRQQRPVEPAAFAMIADASAKEPLAPEPYLVRGVRAQLAGDDETAQRAFEEAQWRDPRSLPAAYFLADRYLRAGDIGRGLHQVAVLARLSPSGASMIGPYLATYAGNRSNWPALRTLFRSEPDLAEPVLTALATNIATVPAVLALADPRRELRGVPWLPPLLTTLTGAGQYAEARALWGQATGASQPDAPLLYDASFRDKASPPPFNWALASSEVGLAERQPGGGLHIVFYGQEDGILASQLLLLRPGRYRLSMRLLGDAARAGTLDWSIWCDKAAAPIASVTLPQAAAHGWQFAVPADCPAQWLKLSGASSDISQQTDLTIGGLKLEKENPGA